MNKGFTLLEVMIALVIVGVGLSMATVSMGKSYKTNAYLEKAMAADLAARNLMDRFRTPYIQPIKPVTENSKIQMGGYEFPYKQSITSAAMEGLKKVDITVYDSDNRTELRKLSMFATVK